jgi:hypothetical protein
MWVQEIHMYPFVVSYNQSAADDVQGVDAMTSCVCCANKVKFPK